MRYFTTISHVADDNLVFQHDIPLLECELSTSLLLVMDLPLGICTITSV